MADIDPSFIPLPQILDPVLSYLSSILPPPLYSFLLTLLSHCLALFTSLLSLCYSLFSSSPTQWDAQTLIPPLISFLAAYLALVSLYRTTSWMLRTGVWFLKWGTIVGVLFAGAGWLAANGGGGGEMGRAGVGGGGMMAFLSGLVLDAINGGGQNAAGGSRTRSRTRPQSQSRPKVWDSFQQNRDWQYQDNTQSNHNHERSSEQGNGMVQGIIENIVGAAERGGWLAAAQRAMDGFQSAGTEPAGTANRKQPARKAKTKARAKGGSK